MVQKDMNNYKKISLLVTAAFLLFFITLTAGYNYSKRTSSIVSVPMQNEAASQPSKNDEFTFRNKEHFSDPEQMPDISFLSPEGKAISWNSFQGKFTLVNIWATWCSPCVVELPTLQKLGEVFEEEMSVIAISVDMTGDQERLRAFLKPRNISDFALYFDKNKEIQKKMPLRGIPTTFLLNPDGKLLYVFEGEANWSAPPAIAFFRQLLKDNY